MLGPCYPGRGHPRRLRTNQLNYTYTMRAFIVGVALWEGIVLSAPGQVVHCSNPEPVVIRDANSATPYPSSIVISNADWKVGKIAVALSNLSHTAQSDVNVLLVGPQGQAAYLIAGPNGTMDFTGVNLTLDDTAASFIPSVCVSGIYKPTGYLPEIHASYPVFPAPAPAGPYAVGLSAFEGTDPNGTWSLFIFDDEGGDQGELQGGWSLQFEKTYPLQVKARPDAILEISWPAEAIGYIVISSSDLAEGHWSVLPNIPTVEGGKKVVRLPSAGEIRFFRLFKF